MCRILVLALLSFPLISASCLAQASDPSRQFRDFGNRLVGGTWRQTKPQGVKARHTYVWALGNQFLLMYMEHGGEPNALAVRGIDPETKRQTWWQFRDDGEVLIASEELVPLGPKETMFTVAGAIATGKFKGTWSDKDTIELVPQPGAQLANGQVPKGSTWKRDTEVDDLSWINAEAPEEIPPQLKIWNLVTGQKWIEGETSEEGKIIGGSQSKWILDGKFHLYTGSTSSALQTGHSHVIISGVDPKTGKVASWEFTSSGAKSTVTPSDDGTTIIGKYTAANGEKSTFKGRFTVDGNVLRYKSEIGKAGEKPRPYGWNYHDVK